MIKKTRTPQRCGKAVNMVYIGVDLGTSACKFLLVDETGRVCRQVTQEYPLRVPHPWWS